MSPSSSCFNFETSVTTSPFRTVELFQSGSTRVEDTMYLGRLFNLSASSPLRDGHRAAKNSYLRRPNRKPSARAANGGRDGKGFGLVKPFSQRPIAAVCAPLCSTDAPSVSSTIG